MIRADNYANRIERIIINAPLNFYSKRKRCLIEGKRTTTGKQLQQNNIARCDSETKNS